MSSLSLETATGYAGLKAFAAWAWGLGFRVWGLGYRSLGFGGLGYRSLGFWGLGFRVGSPLHAFPPMRLTGMFGLEGPYVYVSVS